VHCINFTVVNKNYAVTLTVLNRIRGIYCSRTGWPDMLCNLFVNNDH